MLCSDRQFAMHEPLFDIHPITGVSIEVFYADRSLETFGWHAICATASAKGLTPLRNWLPNFVQPFFVPSSRLTVICATLAISKTGLAF